MVLQKTILIIDDEPFLAQVLRRKLTLEGFSVINADNGEAGLSQAFANHPDLILLDLVMPKMDGITALKKLRQDPWGKTVPVVVLSNLNNARVMDESLAGGAQAFLVKVNNSLEDVARIVKREIGA